jgi:hypothetical protein
MEASVPGDARHPLPRRSCTTGIGFVMVGSLIFAFCAVTCVASIPTATTVVRNRQEIQALSSSEKWIQFEGVTDLDMTALPDLAEVHQIWFKECPALHGEGFMFLARLPNLHVVEFENCPMLDDDSMRRIASFARLERIYIQGPTKISDAGIRELEKLNKLYAFHFDSKSSVTQLGLQELKRAFPKCRVYGPGGEVKLD